MKAGDLVRVIGVPPLLPDNPETRDAFARSVGRTFTVIAVRGDGQAELEVGEVMGVLACLHSIWVEPECIEIVQATN